MVTSLYRQISDYLPKNDQEKQDQKVMLAYIELFDTILTRENAFAHMTSSPWIFNEDMSKVLMVYHNIYQSWSWCGGHCDGNENLQEVAVQEGKEETGLLNLQLVSNEILGIDILPVPPHKKHGRCISAHVHLNTTYLCIADEKEALQFKADENSAVRWIAVEDLDTYVSEKDMLIVYKKLMKHAIHLRKYKI